MGTVPYFLDIPVQPFIEEVEKVFMKIARPNPQVLLL